MQLAMKRPEPQLSQDNLREIIEMQSSLGSVDFDLDAFMNTVVERLQDFTRATGAVIELVEDEEMVYRATSGALAPFMNMRLKVAGSLSGFCVRSKAITLSEDTSCDPRVDAAACKKVSAASMVVVPLLRKQEVLGVLKVISNRAHAFNEHDVYTLQLLAGLLGGALGQQLEVHHQQKKAEQYRHQAQSDALTGLPNRALFNDRLHSAITRQQRSKTLLCVMYMDVDKFKTINDIYGHGTGDAVLKEFASRLRDTVRAADTVARLGGDEFILLAENLKNAEEAQRIASKIIEAIRLPFAIGADEINVSTSIGIALSSAPRIAADTLINEADGALYTAKKAGRNCFEFAAAS